MASHNKEISPVTSMEDAAETFAWVVQHDEEYSLNRDRIFLSGFSAGGHLAASLAYVPPFNEYEPAGTILWFPCVDTPEDLWFASLLLDEEEPMDYSPYHQIKEGMAPTIIFHGSKDETVPVYTVRNFDEKMKALGNESALYVYEGIPHVISQDPQVDEETKELALEFMERFKQ